EMDWNSRCVPLRMRAVVTGNTSRQTSLGSQNQTMNNVSVIKLLSTSLTVSSDSEYKRN
ncbi:hypothetical protein J6590_014386, partial [Homalodisca vitripennis]